MVDRTGKMENNFFLGVKQYHKSFKTLASFRFSQIFTGLVRRNWTTPGGHSATCTVPLNKWSTHQSKDNVVLLESSLNKKRPNKPGK